MKFICNRQNLKEAIGLCEKNTGKHVNMPILSDVLIETDGKFVKLSSTNLEVGLEIKIAAIVEEGGKVAVPASVIGGFLSNLTGEEKITIESQNSNIVISSLNSSTMIKSHSPEEFPIIPKIDEKTAVEAQITASDLTLGLKSVMYACSFSTIKPEISSVYIFSNNGENVTFVATDSFRLAEKKLNYPINNFGPILIPIKTVLEIIRIFDDKTENLKISFDKNQINFELDNIRFISRIVDGVFPDYKQVLPKSFKTDVIVNKTVFTNSLKTTGIFSGKLNDLNISIDNDNNSMIIKTHNNDVGESTTKVPSKINGESMKATFNHKYIFDCLSSISSDEIILRFSGEGKPLVISGANDGSFQYLVMPMNV